MTKHETDVKKYFNEKAAQYDLVDEQVYWRLSDALLWDALKLFVLDSQKTNFKFLDAGGGTGRWSKKILSNYEHSTGTIYDLTKSMLLEAEKKIDDNIVGRLKLINGDIQNMKDISDNTYDAVFNFHNVLGFVENSEKAISEMVRVTKTGGKFVSFVPNIYHLIFFNIYVGRVAEAERALNTGKGRFTENMPNIDLFSPESITELYAKSGVKVDLITGFPISIYPGMQETKLTGSSENIRDILGDSENFKRVYEIERKILYSENNVSARGNNIFIVGTKK